MTDANSSEIVVMPADLHNAEHASAVCALLQEYALDPMGGGEALSPDVLERLIPALQARTNAVCFLAWQGARAVGLLTAFEGFSTFQAKPLLNIHDIVVHSPHRGQGVGQKLLGAAEHEALRRGCCKLTLEVLSNNTVAQTAYRKAGFEGYQLDPKAGQALFWQKKLPGESVL